MSQTQTVSDANFQLEVLNSDRPVLVDFWAPWCGPCRAVGPAIDDLAQQYGDRVKVGKLNVDENQKLRADSAFNRSRLSWSFRTVESSRP